MCTILVDGDVNIRLVVGNSVISKIPSLKESALEYLGIHYLLDLDYAKAYNLGLSILHYLLLNDSKILGDLLTFDIGLGHRSVRSCSENRTFLKRRDKFLALILIFYI